MRVPSLCRPGRPSSGHRPGSESPRRCRCEASLPCLPAAPLQQCIDQCDSKTRAVINGVSARQVVGRTRPVAQSNHDSPGCQPLAQVGRESKSRTLPPLGTVGSQSCARPTAGGKLCLFRDRTGGCGLWNPGGMSEWLRAPLVARSAATPNRAEVEEKCRKKLSESKRSKMRR